MRKRSKPAARAMSAKTMVWRSVVAKRKTQPAKAMRAGKGKSHIRKGR